MAKMARKARASSTVWAPRTSLLPMRLSVVLEIADDLVVDVLGENGAEERIDGLLGRRPPLGHRRRGDRVDDEPVLRHHLHGIRLDLRRLVIEALGSAGRRVEEGLMEPGRDRGPGLVAQEQA